MKNIKTFEGFFSEFDEDDEKFLNENVGQRDNPLSSLLNVYVEYKKNNNIHFTLGWDKHENYFTIRFPNLKADYEEIDANYIMISKDIEMSQRVFDYLKDYIEGSDKVRTDKEVYFAAQNVIDIYSKK
jgi:hypothetical protein